MEHTKNPYYFYKKTKLSTTKNGSLKPNLSVKQGKTNMKQKNVSLFHVAAPHQPTYQGLACAEVQLQCARIQSVSIC